MEYSELKQKALKVANELNDFNSSLDRKAERAIRELLEAADTLRTQNKAMLEALKDVYNTCDWHGDDGKEAIGSARAAIKLAEEKDV